MVVPRPQLHVVVIYDRIRFDADSIARVLLHLRTLLEAIAANPERPLSQLPMMTGAEQRQVLVEWNDTRADFPLASCVHHLFEQQAERTPDAVAVTCSGDELTYADLNHRANQLAYSLAEDQRR